MFFVLFFCCVVLFFFLMIRRPPRSTLDRSSAASDVYKRQVLGVIAALNRESWVDKTIMGGVLVGSTMPSFWLGLILMPVSYTHLRAHETVLDLVCRLLLEKKKNNVHMIISPYNMTRKIHKR